MENIVNLEQLDYRDQLIKEYIDNHSRGNSDYIQIRLFTTAKYSVDNRYGRRLYLGLPTGTDPSGLSLKYLRKSRYSERDRANATHERCTGFHEVWRPPYYDGETRFDPLIKLSLSESIIFTKHGYDYYEVFGLVDDEPYHMDRYINMDSNEFYTGYTRCLTNGECSPVTIAMILRHKLGGIVIMKNGTIISNLARFAAIEYPVSGSNNYSIRLFNDNI